MKKQCMMDLDSNRHFRQRICNVWWQLVYKIINKCNHLFFSDMKNGMHALKRCTKKGMQSIGKCYICHLINKEKE